MFRPMRRYKNQITEEECKAILKTEWRGVLSVHGEDGYPYALPIDFMYDETSGKILFHCAKEGHKIDALKKDNRVSFCVYDKGNSEGDWSLHFKSVIVFGKIRFIDDEDETYCSAEKFGAKFFPTHEELDTELNSAVRRVQMLELTPDCITGKRVHEK